MPDVLPPADQKAASVRAMFDRIADRYDLLNRVLTGGNDLRWRREVVRRLGVGPEDRVLDLATGTGDFAAIARAAGAEVIALDFARRMLEIGRDRRRLDVHWVQGDALRLPFADGVFSVVVSGFALRNFVEIPPVLREAARVLAPGGRLGLLEVDEPGSPIVRRLHQVYFRHLVPLVGGLLSGDRVAYRYLPASTAYLPPARTLARWLQEAGFREARRRRYMFGAIQAITAVRG